jgi:hypothetical protein
LSGIEIGRTTAATILAEAGLDPAPVRKRRRTWKHFFASHLDTLHACDFFAVEALGSFCSVRLMVFFVIELRTRAAHIAGIRIDPDGAWMRQVARQLLDPTDGFLRYATYLIHDRDPLFTAAWTTLLESGGVSCVPIPARSPKCNPHAERFVKTGREECLDQLVTFGEKHLRHLLREFVAHYNEERHHQGLVRRLIRPGALPNNDNGLAERLIARLGSEGCSISIVAPRRDGRYQFTDTTGYRAPLPVPPSGLSHVPRLRLVECGTNVQE